ncbi:hypothetical protein [Janthinobacterium fluminis]|uniref:Uncharacterized protein n=1 Tax=Janthinobacterium fluminis TaxID=2987524 RepID=A0ABT5K7M9_9BURK|nr:hypothetical protein [Janthinobacterium fluminis]MDC8759762.1 hypothetical protein [Janthinobacterium fluminis]
MIKKLAVFLFALACSASYAVTAAEPACYEQCHAQYLACHAGPCWKYYQICVDACDAQG